jgi:hypothetical protein
MDEEMRKRMQRELHEEQQKQKEKVLKFRHQCAKQLDENKICRDAQKQIDWEEDNKPPSGTDLMAQIYEEKKHKSYEKRAR